MIERTLELNAWLNDDALRATIGKVERLPSTPRLFAELSKLLDDETATVDAVVEVVRQDPAMSSKLLQLVNSSFFASSSNVSNVRTAVLRLGMKTIRNLAPRYRRVRRRERALDLGDPGGEAATTVAAHCTAGESHRHRS